MGVFGLALGEAMVVIILLGECMLNVHLAVVADMAGWSAESDEVSRNFYG